MAATELAENSSLTPNRAHHSNPPARSLRSDRCGRHRAIRLCVFLRRMLEPPTGENAVPRSRLFPPAKRLPVRDLLSRLQCSRGLAGAILSAELGVGPLGPADSTALLFAA